MKTNGIVLSIIGAMGGALTLLITMFMTEIKIYLVDNWNVVLFVIFVLMIIAGLLSLWVRYSYKQTVKEENEKLLQSLVDCEKRNNELRDYLNGRQRIAFAYVVMLINSEKNTLEEKMQIAQLLRDVHPNDVKSPDDYFAYGISEEIINEIRKNK